MIKISNAIPRDMTTDSGDCWLPLAGVSVPSSTAAGQGPEELHLRPAPLPRAPIVEGGQPAALSSPNGWAAAGPGLGEGGALSSSHCRQQKGPLKPSQPATWWGRPSPAGQLCSGKAGHGGECQHGLWHGGCRAGTGRAWLEHTDRHCLLGDAGRCLGSLIVRQVDPLAQAGPRPHTW